MNNQALIKTCLTCGYLKNNLKKSKIYNNPLKYRGSVVVDMVKLDLVEA